MDETTILFYIIIIWNTLFNIMNKIRTLYLRLPCNIIRLKAFDCPTGVRILILLVSYSMFVLLKKLSSNHD